MLSDDDEYRRRSIIRSVVDGFDLTDQERAKMLPSGKGLVVRNRVGWAIAYLKQAGLLQTPTRGVYQITDRGKEALAAGLDEINNDYLMQFDEFNQFKSRARASQQKSIPNTEQASETPEEELEIAYQQYRSQVESELLDAVIGGSPDFFEKTVITLLVSMGYGGSLSDAGRAVGRTGDEGIDGIIKEDRLGLDKIYIQAKKWQGTTVGRPDIQKFAGALQGQGASKGIFITTSKFSRDANEYADRIGTSIVLIDGERIASLMYEHGVGVSHQSSYDIKRIDSDFFADD